MAETHSSPESLPPPTDQPSGAAAVSMRAHRIGGTNVHLYPSLLKNESRLLKETATLARTAVFDQVLIVGRWEPGLAEKETLANGVRLLRIPTPASNKLPGVFRRFTRTPEWASRVRGALQGEKLTCVNVHSLPGLSLGCSLAKSHGARLIYDTHELETESVACTGIRKPISKWMERRLIHKVDHVITVGESIADWYRTAYGISNVTCVKNYPSASTTPTSQSGALRAKLSIPTDALLFMYLGILAHGRFTEGLLQVFSRLQSAHVVFVGFGGLEDAVRDAAREHPNIHYLPVVSPHEIGQTLADADVGLSIIENVCLSYYHSMPNKVFECLNAGVPVIVSNFPEVSRVVNENKCGWTVEPALDAVMRLIQSLDANEIVAKRAAAQLVAGQFTWAREEPKLLDIYYALAKKP